MAVSAEVAAAWARAAQFITSPAISQSRTAPLRTTVRLAATAVTVTRIMELEQEAGDFLEMAVTDAAGVVVVAAARVAMVVSAERPLTPTAALMVAEVAAAEHMFREERALAPRKAGLAVVGFSAEAVVEIPTATMTAANQPAREAVVAVVAVASTTFFVSWTIHVVGMAVRAPTAVEVAAAWAMEERAASAAAAVAA